MAQYKNIEDYVNAKLKQVSDKQMEKAFLFSVMSTIGKMGIRIFEYGISSSSRSIGKYNTNGNGKKWDGSLYVSNFNSPRRGTLRGKTGKNKFKTGNRHRTTYYENYKSFRDAMGRQSSFVNLRLSGQLYRNFLNSLAPDDVLGARPVTPPAKVTPKKLGKLEYAITLRPNNMAKAKGAEKHFSKKIFDLTRLEKEDLRNVYKFEVVKLLKL